MKKVTVANLNIDSITKQEFLAETRTRLLANQKTWVITPYSEFLYHALKDKKLMEILNRADFSVADGIGIFWAKKYLEIPLTAKSFWGKILQSAWQLKYSLAAILFYPQWIKSALPEKIVGADLIWDLCALAEQNNQSVFFFGGLDDVPKLTAEKISAKFPKLKIVGYSSKKADNPDLYDQINKASPDMLFVGLEAIKQELWISASMQKLNAKLQIGLGGTFDYIAGKRAVPPKFMRYAGLEWLWRLVTQPFRARRIFNATFGLITALMRYKIFMSYSFRPNVVSIILNRENKILICKRNPDTPDDKKLGFQKKDMLDYWQFSQGGMDAGEDISQTAIRECREELGIADLKILKISEKKYSYLYPNVDRPLLMNQSKFKGQKQSIAYLRYFGPDNAVKVDNIEFVNYKWVPLAKLSEEVHEHRKPVAEIAQQDLKEMQEKGII